MRAWQELAKLHGRRKVPVKRREAGQEAVTGREQRGSGSGNGAAVLHGLNVLWDMDLSLKELCDAGAELGSDVPFCVMGQAAATAALISARDDDYEDVRRMKRTYDIRRRLLVSELRRMGLPCFEPRGAFYVFPNISGTGMTSEEFCDAFLMEEHVACIPGTAFGESGEGFIRISYAAATKDIEKALEKMQAFLKRHGG